METKFTVDYVKNYSASLADDFQIFLDALDRFNQESSTANKITLYKEWEYLMFAIKGSLVVDVIRDDFAYDFCKHIGGLVHDKL